MKKILIILGSIVVVGCLSWFGLSYWYGGNRGGGGIQQYAPDTVQAGEPQSTTELKVNNYSVGQYLDWVGRVSEYVHDCGGGEYCWSYLRVSLPENMRTNDISEARIFAGECVDETLRSDEIVRVVGNIRNIVPDIGLIFSCENPGTSVTRDVRKFK